MSGIVSTKTAKVKKGDKAGKNSVPVRVALISDLSYIIYMMKKSDHIYTKLIERYSFHNLLVWLLLYLVAGPFLTGRYANTVLSLAISLVLLFAAYTINTKSKLFKYSIGLMGFTLILYWMDIFNVIIISRITSRIIMAFYLGILIYAFTRYVLTARRVTSQLISAALCLYLILGTFWGIIYDITYILAPGSYKGHLLANCHALTETFQHFQYFSFVTLTTLGYGDILPQTRGAAALCQAEAIIGQFFMAVLVARLVGIQVSQKFTSENRGTEDSGQGAA